MDPEFWHERWTRGEIGFHQHDFNAHMQAFTDRLGMGPGDHVFVPLCGKSLDLLWLLRRGYRVTGVEINRQAVRDFFSENRIEPHISEIPAGELFQAQDLAVFRADFFATDFPGMPAIDAVYDRAALVALPPDMRKAYAERMLGLVAPGVRTLLVTLDYPQQEMRGPPFAVTLEEVGALYAEKCRLEILHSEDCLEREPRFRKKGLTRLTEHVLLLERKPDRGEPGNARMAEF
jgi:thiopurine S-methyltransferase